MKALVLFPLLATLAGTPVRAEDFDYYVMALSWSPSWCAAEVSKGDPPEQCTAKRHLGFSLHGLWPQFSDGGWPEFCDSREQDPSRAASKAMADIMGSSGLAWYQWKKHGRCSGLSAAGYYNLSRRAFNSVALPNMTSDRETALDIEQAFLDANPALRSDNLIVTCVNGTVREVRICLSPTLEPQACAEDVQRDACRLTSPLSVPPIP